MKIIGLLLALLLIAFGLSSLLFFSFVNLSFNWEDFLIYLVIAAIVYFLVKIIGGSLNRKFDKLVDGFIKGDKEELKINRGLTRDFGLLIITMLPFLLFLLAFGLFSAATFSFYGFYFISFAERIPVAIPIGLAIVALGTALGVLIGLFRLFFPKQRVPYGIDINKNEEKNLWSLTSEIAKYIEAKPIDKIIVTPDPGLGVYLKGSLFKTIFGGGQRVLEVGLSSIHGLDVSEFKAVLAHEYGHFSNRDTQWSSFTYSLGNSLVEALKSTPGPPKEGSSGGFGLVRLVMALNPAYWILFIFVTLYFQVTSGFSRIREVMADIRAINMYGGEAFSDGLVKVAANDLIFTSIVQDKHIPELLKEGKVISNFSKYMDFVVKDISRSERQNYVEEVESKKPDNTYDNHPAIKLRLAYAQKLVGPANEDKRPIQELFENWDKINEDVANLYNTRLAVLLNYFGQPSGSENSKTENIATNAEEAPEAEANTLEENKIEEKPCNKCGKVNNKEAVYCKYCGNKL